MKRFFARFIRHQQGIALIEFAIIFPFFFLLIFGGIELARYIIIIQKVEKAAYAITDLVAQYPKATSEGAEGEINRERVMTEVIPQFHRMMGNYGVTSREAVIISSVVKRSSGSIRLAWQRSLVGGSVPGVVSITGYGPSNTSNASSGFGPEQYGYIDGDLTYGTVCPPVAFPPDVLQILNDTAMLKDENMIVGEMFFRYRPIVGSLFGVMNALSGGNGGFSIAEQTLVRRFYLSPRNGTLLHLPPNHPVKPDTTMICLA